MSRRKRGSGASQKKPSLDIRTVANAAGVSVATVSRVINKVASVDPQLAKRVRDAVRKLGYVPNTQARALVSGKSKLLGVIISDITNPFFPELIQGFEDAAVEAGYETLIGSTNYDLERMELCVDRMLERKVEGVAVMTFGIEEPLLDRLASQGIPMVFIDIGPRKKNIATIHVNYEKGIREAVQHLAALGHRNVGFIAGPQRLHSANARLNAFLTAAKNIGIETSNCTFQGDHTAEGGKRGIEYFLSQKIPPTAIVCSNDLTAIGAMHSISQAGLSVPTDLSLVGFDDIQIAGLMIPPLTTIRMSGREIAASAVTSLLKPDVAPRPVETALIVRHTTGPLKKSLHSRESKGRKTPRRR